MRARIVALPAQIVTLWTESRFKKIFTAWRIGAALRLLSLDEDAPGGAAMGNKGPGARANKQKRPSMMRALASAQSMEAWSLKLEVGRRSPLPHLRQDCAHPSHICTGTGLTPAASAPGLGSTRPHLRRGRAHPAHICTRTGLTPPTSAPGLRSPQPHLRRGRAHPAHICAGSGLDPATTICARTGLALARRDKKLACRRS
jgi:hypothetical protein